MFEPVGSRVSFPEVEERTLSFWKDKNIFERSVEQRQGKPRFVFYEGPPFANGNPGIHHVLARTFKDVIIRYRVMKGYYVPRIAGWDTHGLPVELEVERELGFAGKEQIEQYGVERFNQRCRESVFRYLKEWNNLTERIAYWVDLEKAYMTMNNDYIETVWWAIKQLSDKGFLYQGYRVTPHCPRCGTSLSSHEVALGYEGEHDCYVLGGRALSSRAAVLSLRPALWVDQESLEPVRFDRGDGVRFRLGPSASFGSVRLPSWIEASDLHGFVARLEVLSAQEAPTSSEPFHPSWLSAPGLSSPPPPARGPAPAGSRGRKIAEASLPMAPPRPPQRAPRQSSTLWTMVRAVCSRGSALTRREPSWIWKLHSPPPSPSRRTPSFAVAPLTAPGSSASAKARGRNSSRNSDGDMGDAGNSAIH